VSITRAKKELYMTCCRSRRIWGKTNYFSPSRFLAEVPENLVIFKGFNGGSFFSEELKEGDVVYSKDYGKGQIVKKWVSRNEPVVVVIFESGRTAQFLLNYSNLEKIKNNCY
ncbi:MAG: hypothetical protein FWE72_08155, partial [Spirochaetaceae bacterium]|nr:hypothetical protein [Spirochaetaceae bacterium]